MPGLRAFCTKSTAVILVLMLSIIISSCGILQFTPPATEVSPTPLPSPTPYTQIEVRFEATTPSPDQKVILEILDEVTGLALNPKRYEMLPVASNVAAVTVQFPAGSLVKYRYRRGGESLGIEYSSLGSQVRYRLVNVYTPILVQDIIAGWNDEHPKIETGRIEGKVFDARTHEPIPGILVCAGGNQAFTSSDGTFALRGLPKGTHNLVTLDPTGKYSPFQQGALVEVNATTPAELSLNGSSHVIVKFEVTIPTGNIKGLPVRMAGNLSSLGNTFADLRGGMNVIASRSPLLTQINDTHYAISLSLPVGFDLRYKYTLGDGFWNAEHASNGSFMTRQLIVPDQDLIVEDYVETWRSGDSQPITFTVKVPPETPTNDIISIQFNPFGWTEPIPMWPLGGNKWTFVLFSPLDMLGTVGYRYCRNDLCGAADDIATSGNQAAGYPLNTSLITQNFQDDVTSWKWFNSRSTENFSTPEVRERNQDFLAGAEMQSFYEPANAPYFGSGLERLIDIGANSLIIRPTWSAFPEIEPYFIQDPEQDMSWSDATRLIEITKSKGLNPILYPELHIGGIWQNPDQDDRWWDIWFKQYTRFVTNFVDMAEQNRIEMVIIGGPDVAPALPGGKLPDGSPSKLPDNIAERWEDILKLIRQRYNGKVIWALEFSKDFKSPLPWMNQVDGFYVLWSTRLTKNESYELQALVYNLSNQLDKTVKPYADNYKKPIYIAAGYPSAEGSVQGCIKADMNSCYDLSLFTVPSPDYENVHISFKQQADIYQAFYETINQRDWISGFISRGYNLTTELHDASMSIRGKTAEDLLWYWFSKITP